MKSQDSPFSLGEHRHFLKQAVRGLNSGCQELLPIAPHEAGRFAGPTKDVAAKWLESDTGRQTSWATDLPLKMISRKHDHDVLAAKSGVSRLAIMLVGVRNDLQSKANPTPQAAMAKAETNNQADPSSSAVSINRYEPCRRNPGHSGSGSFSGRFLESAQRSACFEDSEKCCIYLLSTVHGACIFSDRISERSS